MQMEIAGLRIEEYSTFDALKCSPRGWQMICRAARTASRFCNGSAAEETMSAHHLDTVLPSLGPCGAPQICATFLIMR